eukprot:1166967-Rhodomonas_salina.1
MLELALGGQPPHQRQHARALLAVAHGCQRDGGLGEGVGRELLWRAVVRVRVEHRQRGLEPPLALEQVQRQPQPPVLEQQRNRRLRVAQLPVAPDRLVQ